ncbi:MAG: enoyl-CoA hydratase [Peptococcaceae bacterium]
MQKLAAVKENGLGWLVFNNQEKKNAIDYEMWRQIPVLVNEFNDQADIRVIIFRGEGGDFSAGADMSQFATLRNSISNADSYNQAVAEASLAVRNSCKPVIAMLTGYCLGGGCSLALETDIRISDHSVKFGIPAAKRGVGYSYTGVKQLVEIVGSTHAYDLLYTGRIIAGEEGYRLGLINYLVDTEDLMSFTRKYAAIIAENAPLTIKAVRMAIHECLTPESRQDLTKVHAAVADCFASRDYQEGYQAFLEKRKPVFTGRKK